jgi:hypothetical protein
MWYNDFGLIGFLVLIFHICWGVKDDNAPPPFQKPLQYVELLENCLFRGLIKMHNIEILREALTCVQLFVSCATALTLLYAFGKFTQKPNDAMKQRLLEIEKRLDKMDDWKENTERRLHEGVEHFVLLDESSKVTQQALLAIMDNALNPDNGKEELKKSRNRLYEYLAER